MHLEDSLDMPIRELISIIQARLMGRTTYCGIDALKCPLDFWVYQEIIFERRPDVIIEIGTNQGGTLLALAHFCDAIGHGKLIGVDINQASVHETVRAHPRVLLVEGDACSVFPEVRDLVPTGASTLIIEDSSHTLENTLAVLNTYGRLSQPGDYFIVEDTNIGHGLMHPDFTTGPYEAVEAFLQEHAEFERDRSRESFLVTWNPGGYLRRR